MELPESKLRSTSLVSPAFALQTRVSPDLQPVEDPEQRTSYPSRIAIPLVSPLEWYLVLRSFDLPHR